MTADIRHKSNRRDHLPVLLIGCLALLISGCCSVIPFKKCQTRNIISATYTADADCNGGFHVRTRLLVLANDQLFQQVHPDRIFPTPDTGLHVQKYKDVHIEPSSQGVVDFALDDVPDLTSLYLGVIAHFEEAETPGSDRILIPLTDRKGTIKVTIELSGSRLQGKLAGG